MRRRPVVAIVGRPNVGKSTLFNRLFGERKAVVHALPGMTRDRHYADAVYRMRPYTMIDTGGYEDHTDSRILQQMRLQSIIAMDEADAIIFLTEVTCPNDPTDQEILERLRASGKPFFLAVNKVEGRRSEAQAYADFSVYGLDQIFPISGLNGDGVYDLMDAVTDSFQMWDTNEEEETPEIRVALVGRQNVGKSTLLNRLFGSERVIANPLPGTTRDAIDADITVDGESFVVIDTAGIRRRGKIEKGPEKLSVHSSFRAIDRAHVCLLVIDASEGITAQDMHVASYILERRRACIIVLNKWDAVQDREKNFKEKIKEVREQFNFMAWAPILTVSALTGQRTNKVWDLIRSCSANFRKQFKTSVLNQVLKRATSHASVPTLHGNVAAIKYVTQTGGYPPTFSFFVNEPKLVHFSYRRYLSNQFYQQLGIEGTPIVLRFRRKAPAGGWDSYLERAKADALAAEAEARRNGIKINEDDPEQPISDKPFYGGIYDDEGEMEVVQEFDLGMIESEDGTNFEDDDGEDDDE